MILGSLRRHRDLVDQEANVLNISESRLFRKEVMNELEHIREWRLKSTLDIEVREKERLKYVVREVAAWLGASSHQEDILEKHLKSSKTTKSEWIFQTPYTALWLKETRHIPLLWINGKPGAGWS